MRTRAFTAGFRFAAFLVLLLPQASMGQGGGPLSPPGNPLYSAPYNPNDYQFYPAPGGGGVTPPQLSPLAKSLATEAQQLLDNLRFELYGTFEGRQLEMRAGAVLSAASQVARNAQFSGPGDTQTAAAMAQFDRAFAELNRVMGSVGRSTPRSSASMDRLQRVAFQIRNIIGVYGPMPGGPAPLPGIQPIVIPGLPCSVRTLADATANLRIAANNYTSLVQTSFRDLANSAIAFNNQVIYFQGLQSSAVRFEDIRRSCEQIRFAANDISNLLARTNAPPPVIQSWTPVLDSLNRVSGLLNIPGQIILRPPGPGGGVIVNPGLPIPLPGVGPFPGPDFMGLLDQVIAESDGFLEGISANAAAVPGGYRFVADARNLRASLINLSRQAQAGARRRDLLQTLSVAQRHSNAIQRRIATVARGRIGPNIARFHNLAGMIDQLQAMLN